VGTSPRVSPCLTISQEIQRTRNSSSHLFLKSIRMGASMMSSACTRFCSPDSRSAFANHELAAFVVSVFHRLHPSDSVTSSVCIQRRYSVRYPSILVQFPHLPLSRQWALASVYAHRAYGDSSVLQYAKSVYEAVTSQQITAGNPRSGGRNFSVATTCNGSMFTPLPPCFGVSSRF
jgi:hypothetical protein